MTVLVPALRVPGAPDERTKSVSLIAQSSSASQSDPHARRRA
jgi:hypothetical protein